jgi:transcriptional regulator of heat shock response
MNIAISHRQDSLLEFIIREFVKTAKPVPSALVCSKSRLNVSPATVRNEMNDLEEQGFLSQLHTSGGRVPTDKAYRYFVNRILAREELAAPARMREAIRAGLTEAGTEPRAINKAMADLISRLAGNLVITGIDHEADFFKVGLTSLFEMPEFREFKRMFQLTSFFEEFDQLFQQLEREFFAPMRLQQARLASNINVFIGRENPFNQVRGETVIVAKYPLPRGYIGSLTLIGPTRMDYEKNIALIKCATDELRKRVKTI